MKIVNKAFSAIYERLSLNALAKGHYDQAEKWLLKQEQADQNHQRFLRNMGSIKLAQRKYQEAYSLFHEEMKTFGEDSSRLRVLADVSFLCQKMAEANSFYKKALSFKENKKLPYLESRLKISSDEKLFSEGIKAQEYFETAQNLENEKRWEEALSYYEKSFSCDPSHYIAANNAGAIFLNHKKDFRQALKYFRSSQDLYPLPMTTYNINLCQELLKKDQP